MRFPWANVFILLLGSVELVTGFLGLTGGSPDWVSALHIHRIVGFSIVALLMWKGQNILASMLSSRRWRHAFIPYLASLLLLCLLLTALTLGLVWSHAGPFRFMGFSGVSLAHLPFASHYTFPPVAHRLPQMEHQTSLLGGETLLSAGRWACNSRAGALAHRRTGQSGFWLAGC